MSRPFEKAVLCTDQHFGRNSNSPTANQDNLDFFQWFIDEAKHWGADTVFLTGDYFDNRNSIHVSTMDYAIRGLDMLSKNFKKVYALLGNHDLLYRNRRDITSMAMAQYLPNFVPIYEPTRIGEGKDGITLLPWLVGDEHKMCRSINTRYVFGHLELPGWMMNAKVPMPHHGDGVTEDDFKGGAEYVFTGHFHFRQARGNVVYAGNIMPFNFADVDDSDRGMMFLEWGKEPFFKAWSDQPLFKTLKLSQMIDHADTLLKSKMTVRCLLDIDISFEESQLIKETFVKSHGLRRLELTPMPKESVKFQEFREDTVFQSVDQIVMEGLLSIDSNELKQQKLIEIYRNLPDL